MANMDVTPQLIEQIDFSEKFRGYDPDQVDDFLERVGATIAELNNAVREANDRAERAEYAAREAMSAAPAPVATPAAMSDEDAATTAARTLMLAQRTADQVVAESRAEADQLLAEARQRLDLATRDAQVEADRLLADARVQAEGIVRAATEEVERELAARRREVADQVADLEHHKQLLAADVGAIEGRLAEYRNSLDRVQASIRTILDDPEALRQRPELGIDLTPTMAVPFVEATASEPQPDMAPWAPEVTDSPSAVTAVEGGGFTVGVDDDAATGSTPVESSWAVESPQEAPDVAGQPVSGVEFAPLGDPATDAEPAPADPWGPGSWSEIIAEASEEPAPTVAWDSVAFAPPTGSSPAVAQDRYLRDLDEAVNAEGEPVDDAMTAFFEGDDAEPQRGEGRRFRRR